MFLKFRPKPPRAVGYRVFANFAFWAVVMWWLGSLSIYIKHFVGLADDGAKAITSAKILEMADAEVWLIQVLAGILLLGILKLVGYASPEEYPFFKHMSEDDIFAIALNFGTLFVLAALYRWIHGMSSAKLTCFLGSVNILVYAIWSPFEADVFERLRASERSALPKTLSDDPYLVTLISPQAWSAAMLSPVFNSTAKPPRPLPQQRES